MDNILTNQIACFLSKAQPTEEEIKKGAEILLRLDPAHERGIYNSAMRRPHSMLPWIRTDLQKHLNIRKRGLTTEQVEAYNEETLQQVKETLSQAPELPDEETHGDDSSQTPLIPVLGIRGRRPDHDQLPQDVQELYERNSERWRKMRALHAQLAMMISRPDYVPCDGNELCHLLRETDQELRADWQRYDEYVLQNPPHVEIPDGERDGVDVFTDNVKTIQNARTAITRGLKVEKPNKEQLQKLQAAVDSLVALKQTIKPETIERLKAVGVNVPL